MVLYFCNSLETVQEIKKKCLKELKNEVLILISGKFLHLESFSLLNYEANLLIRLFIHILPEIHLIFILQRDLNTAGIKFSSFCWIWVGDPIKGFN